MYRSSYSKLPVTVLATISERLIGHITDANLADIVESDEFAKLKDEYGIYKQSMQKKNNSKLTKEIEAKDYDRDRIILGIKKKIESYLFSRNDKELELARKADEIISAHGARIVNLPYAKESAVIGMLIESFRAPDAAEILKGLNLKIDIDDLEKVQNEFEEAYRKRGKEEQDSAEIDSATSIRKRLEATVNDLVYFSESAAKFKKDKQLKKLYDILSTEIDKQISAWSKNRKKDSGEDNEDTPEN